MKITKRTSLVLFVVIAIMVCSPAFAVANFCKNISLTSKFSENCLVVGNYSLNYGTYKGYNIEHAWDNKSGKVVETSKKEVILKLNPNNTYVLGGTKYKFSINGSNLEIPKFNNIPMIKVVGNNKILLQVGSGIELTYICE